MEEILILDRIHTDIECVILGGVFCFPVVKAKISIFDGHVDLRCARSAIFFKDFDFLGRGSSKFRPQGHLRSKTWVLAPGSLSLGRNLGWLGLDRIS